MTAIASTIFSVAPGAVPAQSAVSVRIGDDVAVPFAVVDVAGNPVNATGATFGAAVYDQFAGTLAASVQITSFSTGLGLATVPAATTALLTPQTFAAPIAYGRLSVWMIDSAGKRHTFDPIGLLALRPQDFADVAVAPPLQTLVIAGTQGPAAPANLSIVNSLIFG